MKKIRLDAEALVVESFEMSSEGGEAGTVQAHMPGTTQPLQTANPDAWTCNAVQWTCLGNCGWETNWHTYCGPPCGDTSPQYDTCWDTCEWP
jgi:hypothetical protein